MQELIEQFKGLTNISNKTARLLNAYHKLKENPVGNAYLMEKKLTEILKTVNQLPDFPLKTSLLFWVNQEKDVLAKTKDDFRFQFGNELKKLLQNDNRSLRGQYPILRFGFYTLKLNFEFGEAELYFGPEVEKLKSKIPLQPQNIFEIIKKYDKELQESKFDKEKIFKELGRAYKNRLTLTDKSVGDKILLTEVLHEFVLLQQSEQFMVDPKKEHYREFSRVKLSYLIYLLKKSDLSPYGIRLHVATFDATTNKLHAIWIPENEEGEGTYYSYISFGKV